MDSSCIKICFLLCFPFSHSMETDFLNMERDINIDSRSIKASTREDGERVIVSGGGVIKPGANVTLTLEVGEPWERCYWFRYGHVGSQGGSDYCSFEQDPISNTTTLRKCDSQELRDMVVPLSTSPFSCSIMLIGMDARMEGKWASRLGTDLNTKEMELTMQRPPTEVELVVETPEIEVGKETTVTCICTGGTPTPRVMFTLQTNSSSNDAEFSDVTLVSEVDETLTFSANFVPRMEDVDKRLGCIVIQEDNNGDVLYNVTQFLASNAGVLPLQYPPQPQEEVQVHAVLGESVILSTTVRSNPAPTTVQWLVDGCQELEEDDIPCSFNIGPGQDNDKFNASQISELSDGNYLATLSISNVEEDDLAKSYTLTVTNRVGEQTYELSLTSDPTTTTTTSLPTPVSPTSNTTETTDGQSRNVIVIIVGVVIVALVAVGAVLFYRRKKATDGELSPLTQTP